MCIYSLPSKRGPWNRLANGTGTHQNNSLSRLTCRCSPPKKEWGKIVCGKVAGIYDGVYKVCNRWKVEFVENRKIRCLSCLGISKGHLFLLIEFLLGVRLRACATTAQSHCLLAGGHPGFPNRSRSRLPHLHLLCFLSKFSQLAYST